MTDRNYNGSPSSYGDWHGTDDDVRYTGGYEPPTTIEACRGGRSLDDVLEEAVKEYGPPDGGGSNLIEDYLYPAAFETTPGKADDQDVKTLREALHHVCDRDDVDLDDGVEPEVLIQGFIDDPEEAEFKEVWKKVLTFLEDYEWFEDDEEDEEEDE